MRDVERCASGGRRRAMAVVAILLSLGGVRPVAARLTAKRCARECRWATHHCEPLHGNTKHHLPKRCTGPAIQRCTVTGFQCLTYPSGSATTTTSVTAVTTTLRSTSTTAEPATTTSPVVTTTSTSVTSTTATSAPLLTTTSTAAAATSTTTSQSVGLDVTGAWMFDGTLSGNTCGQLPEPPPPTETVVMNFTQNGINVGGDLGRLLIASGTLSDMNGITATSADPCQFGFGCCNHLELTTGDLTDGVAAATYRFVLDPGIFNSEGFCTDNRCTETWIGTLSRTSTSTSSSTVATTTAVPATTTTVPEVCCAGIASYWNACGIMDAYTCGALGGDPLLSGDPLGGVPVCDGFGSCSSPPGTAGDCCVIASAPGSPAVCEVWAAANPAWCPPDQIVPNSVCVATSAGGECVPASAP